VSGGVGIGAHTKSHVILPRIESERQIEDEICGSQKRIEEELNISIRHFCYPNGDFDERAEQVVRRNFDTAMTTVTGINRFDTLNQFRLKRIGVEPVTERSAFEQGLTGFRLPKAGRSQWVHAAGY
jgi:peptidoglycan/xylan/chitin deacetylase (PgdA/CDA1 family)